MKFLFQIPIQYSAICIQANGGGKGEGGGSTEEIFRRNSGRRSVDSETGPVSAIPANTEGATAPQLEEQRCVC